MRRAISLTRESIYWNLEEYAEIQVLTFPPKLLHLQPSPSQLTAALSLQLLRINWESSLTPVFFIHPAPNSSECLVGLQNTSRIQLLSPYPLLVLDRPLPPSWSVLPGIFTSKLAPSTLPFLFLVQHTEISFKTQTHTQQFTHLKCAIQWPLGYAHNCASITTINFRRFSLSQKKSVPLSQ